MQPLARLGDIHTCPIHGPNAIVQVAAPSTCDGMPIATVGDLTACGATITTGSTAMFVGGRPAALIGSATSHGGQIIKGSPLSKA